MTLENLATLVNADDALVRRGRFLSAAFIVGIGDHDWLITVENGRIVDATTPPPLMSSCRFSLRAPKAAWEAFWEPVPAPGFHDIFAMTKSGDMMIDGDMYPLMANLRYIKEVLAAPRGIT